MLKYVLLSLAVLYVMWTIYKAVVNWRERLVMQPKCTVEGADIVMQSSEIRNLGTSPVRRLPRHLRLSRTQRIARGWMPRWRRCD
jgi:hypothetical protein